MPKLSIVTPVFNEEEMLNIFFDYLCEFKKQIKDYEIEWIIVDDGSKDSTPDILENLVQKNDFINAFVFSRNFGKEAALFAGLTYSKGDLVVPMDIDLQDPFELILKMILKYKEGADVVLAKRSNRSNDTFLK